MEIIRMEKNKRINDIVTSGMIFRHGLSVLVCSKIVPENPGAANI
jgi:hypothetical protein